MTRFLYTLLLVGLLVLIAGSIALHPTQRAVYPVEQQCA